MGDTVEALAYKGNIPERTKDAINDRVETVRGTVGDVVDSVKQTVSNATSRVGSALGSAKNRAQSTAAATGEGVGDTVGDVRERVGGTVGDVRERVGGTVGDVRERIGATVGGVRERVGATVGNVRGAVSDNVGTLRDRLPDPQTVGSVARRGAGIAAENPLGLALGALALGFLAGLLLPVSDLEREKVGPIRDDLLDRAQTIGGDVVEHGKAVVQDVAQTALDTAQQRAREHAADVLDGGLNPQTIASSVVQHGKQVITETAQAAMQTAQQSAQEHGRQVLGEAGRQEHAGDSAISPGMPSDASQGGGLRGGIDLPGGTGAQTPQDTGKTSKQYADLSDERRNTLDPGSPGTASP